MTDINSLNAAIEYLEPSLEEVMRFHPTAWPEGLRLRKSVCGFASNTLAKCLHAKRIADATLKIGAPVDDVSKLPSRMRRHVVIDTEIATVDPTWSQFMTLVGLDADLAARSADMKNQYPQRQVAVIAKGAERAFGERFAEYALGRVTVIASIRRSMGPDTLYSTDDVCVWMPEDEAFEMLADIWNPERYKDYDTWGDGEALAERATERLLDLTSEQV